MTRGQIRVPADVCQTFSHGVNVKNAAAEMAVRELMALTGEGQAEAIERAAGERIRRIRRAQDDSELERLLGRLVQDFGAADLSTDELYDDRGLPAR